MKCRHCGKNLEDEYRWKIKNNQTGQIEYICIKCFGIYYEKVEK